jgi:hypothetical protein
MLASLAISICYALDTKGNGYNWNAADNKDRVTVCKIIAGKVGKSYSWWLENLNDFYDTTDKMVLNVSIAQAAAQMSVYLKYLEEHGQ